LATEFARGPDRDANTRGLVVPIWGERLRPFATGGPPLAALIGNAAPASLQAQDVRDAHISDRALAPAHTAIRAPLPVRVARETVLLIPVAAAGVFVWLYAISYPLTDEWVLFRNAMIANSAGWSDPVSTLSALTWKIYDHPIVLPNLLYLLIGPVFHFDARACISITLVCFTAMLIVFRTQVASNAWTALPIGFVLFAPSHFSEFVWGFQFTMAMSITLTVLGLAVFNRTTPEESTAKFSARLLCALCLIIAGLLSSGEAVLGLPSLLVLGVLKRLTVPRRRVVVGVSLLALCVATSTLGAGGYLHNISIPRDVMATLTALGAVIVGSLGGLTTFSFNWVAATGLAVCLVILVCALVAWRRGLISELSLPLALFTFGFLLVAAIAVSRPYLGNWHLQAALPAILGAYGAAIVLARHFRSPAMLTLQAITTALVGLVAIGYWQGYSTYGPAGNAYASKVASYMDSYLTDPKAPKPYPPTGGWDFDSAMARFLQDKGPHR
jgi:hypothetical protein